MFNINKKYDELQAVYGDKTLNCIYGGGCTETPELALIFMNPTKRNIAADKNWKGIRFAWLGTKEIFRFLNKCKLFEDVFLTQVLNRKVKDWSEDFCRQVYDEISNRQIYITNLAKCTQIDARPLNQETFLAYKDLLLKELEIVNPKKIILFGNEVASIVLDEKISVSAVRKKPFFLKIGLKEYEAYAVYYPVGNGRFNQHKSIEDLNEILKEKK